MHRRLFHLSTRVQIVVVVVLFGLVLIGTYIWRNYSWRVQPEVQATPSPLPAGFFQVSDLDWQGMEFAPVRPIHFSAVEDTDGTIAAADENTTQVFSPYSGRVTAVYATTGDYVQAGQPLFAIAATEYAQAQNNLFPAETALTVARKTLALAERNRRRQLELLQRGGAAAKDVEQSAVDLATAQAAVKNAETALNFVRAQMQILGQSNAQINALARAPGSTVKIGGVVPAPISGYVISRSVGVGTNIGSATNGGSNALFSISNLSSVYFVAYVPETEIASIHPGDRVAVRLDAFPGRTFDATVRYAGTAVDPNLHRIPVRAEVDNPTGELRPGMYGSFRIYTGPGNTDLSVPEDAVIYEEDTARVWIAGPNHTLALRYIKAGKTVDHMVQVLSGLHSGERVVTSGTVFIDRALRGDQ
jgi:membrane fusion protein, heavy metal efflux system